MSSDIGYESLQHLIAGKREEILQRWMQDLRDELGTPKLVAGELRDHLPMFLDDLAVALGTASTNESPEGSFRPSMHGTQRLRAGFDVDAVVREYGLLGDVILRIAESAAYQPTHQEQRVLLRKLSEGASRAIASYVRRRDDDMRREAGKHLAFVAHELRNPLSAATTALALLKSDDGTPVPKPMRVLERSVGRLCDLIDNVLVAGRFESHVELNIERISVRELLSQVSADVFPHAEARGVTVEFDGEECVGDGDRRLLG